ncbi:hypothetical protein GIR22_07215 [Pseudomonas sp. CCM 7891]|uniref:Type III secretion effector protein n=1 Tax=Pseudomonas karstica TaxID=1055468 RepID=A0A7X2RQ41_9PSED|nr:hypothetical protein [Pseudomonas karstica]MTD18938.1 hypothetical protein [Pseudomonas karstica]
MVIDSSATRGRHGAMGEVDTQPVQGPPVTSTGNSDASKVPPQDYGRARAVMSGRSLLLARADETVLHHRELQNLPAGSSSNVRHSANVPDSPSTTAAKGRFSVDPFHAKSDAEIVQVLVETMEDFGSALQGRSFFFDKKSSVKIEQLEEMSKDPDEIGGYGETIRDPVTGLPRKRYTEHQVYLAKNIVERPKLLDTLDSAINRGSGIFGNSDQKGWLSQKSLERWLENDRVQKTG